MFKGELVAIYTASDAGAPMKGCAQALLDESGIQGDRYAVQAGKYSNDGKPGRAVTLIEREAVAGVVAKEGVTVNETEMRRNLVTEGVPLNHLVGREFRIGATVLRGIRLCEPCVYLEQVTGVEGVREAFIHRGGLRAEVVTAGTVRVGDPIEATT